VEATRWAEEAPDGWGGVRAASPIVEEGWPSMRPEDHGYPTKEGPLGPDGWPDLSLPSLGGVLVTMTVMTTVEPGEGHSACRLSYAIVCFSVSDLLSFLRHSTVGTSYGSCAPRCPHWYLDSFGVHE
jgi:hypothetical protein